MTDMPLSDSVRVYINAKPVDIPATATALDAIEASDPDQATAVRNGERLITDSRGIRTSSQSANNGSLLTVASVTGFLSRFTGRTST